MLNIRRLRETCTTPGLIICALGLVSLAALYVYWWIDTDYSILARAAALLSIALFAWMCIKFVPGWMRFWTPGGYIEAEHTDGEPVRIRLKVFAGVLLWCLATFIIIYIIYLICGYNPRWASFRNFWTLTDSGHYLDIARDWYLSEGVKDRLVQLVFLPGYPIAVRLVHYIVRDWVIAGLAVSWLCFAGAGSVIYSLLRLDYTHEQSIKAIKYLCIIPGSFFFISPMSESMFLLLSAACVYLARRSKTGWGCLMGALAAFTRSLGLILFVPVCMELVHDAVNHPKGKRGLARFLWLLLIPAGFGAYCYINYLVSGDPFKYMQYQSEHWGQNLGLFFNTPAYQLENALSCLSDNLPSFFGLWLPNLLFDFGALCVMVYAAGKMRPGYVAWFIAYYVVAIGATWLLSSPRYMISLIPFFLGFSLLAGGKKQDHILTICCAPLWIYYAVMFVVRWQVW